MRGRTKAMKAMPPNVGTAHSQTVSSTRRNQKNKKLK